MGQSLSVGATGELVLPRELSSLHTGSVGTLDVLPRDELGTHVFGCLSLCEAATLRRASTGAQAVIRSVVCSDALEAATVPRVKRDLDAACNGPAHRFHLFAPTAAVGAFACAVGYDGYRLAGVLRATGAPLSSVVVGPPLDELVMAHLPEDFDWTRAVSHVRADVPAGCVSPCDDWRAAPVDWIVTNVAGTDAEGCSSAFAVHYGATDRVVAEHGRQPQVVTLFKGLDATTLASVLNTSGDSITCLDSHETELTDVALDAVSRQCPRLRRLALPGPGQCTGDGVCVVAQRCRELCCVDLSMHPLAASPSALRCLAEEVGARLTHLEVDYSQVGDSLVVRLSTECPALVRLSLRGCANVTDIGVASLAACTALQSLDLSYLRGVTDHGLVLVVMHCAGLDHVFIEGTPSVTDTSLRALADHARNGIVELVASKVPSVTEQGVVAIVRASPRLQRLCVNTARIAQPALCDALALHCPDLRELDVAFCGWTDEGALLAMITQCLRVALVDVRGRWPAKMLQQWSRDMPTVTFVGA